MIRPIVLSLCLAAPAAAQDAPMAFGLPVGCEAYVTLQLTSCQVRHYFRCETDPAGHQRSVTIREQGVTFLGLIDEETQWMEAFYPQSGTAEQLEDNPPDGASFSTLTETGIDEYNFRIVVEGRGALRHIGADRLTGRTVTIDGVTLEETELEYTRFNENEEAIARYRGNEFINRDRGRFVPGIVTRTDAEGAVTIDNSPVEFIFPGEPGFLSSRPKHGCGAAVS